MSLFRILAIVTFSLFVSQAHANQLAGTEWGISDSNKVFIKFDNLGRVTGFSGCNRFFGEYKLISDTEIEFSELASSRKLCAPDVMKIENEFLSKLDKVRKYDRRFFKLKLFSEEYNLLYNMRQRDWD